MPAQQNCITLVSGPPFGELRAGLRYRGLGAIWAVTQMEKSRNISAVL
jgi:hypothetical protein